MSSSKPINTHVEFWSKPERLTDNDLEDFTKTLPDLFLALKGTAAPQELVDALDRFKALDRSCLSKEAERSLAESLRALNYTARKFIAGRDIVR